MFNKFSVMGEAVEAVASISVIALFFMMVPQIILI